MTSKRLSHLAPLAAAIIVLSAAANAFTGQAAAGTSAGTGSGLFTNYCASCHGVDARGDGPAAASLRVPPTDLTRLARANRGELLLHA